MVNSARCSRNVEPVYHRAAHDLLCKGEGMKRPTDIELLTYLTGESTDASSIEELAKRDSAVRRRLEQLGSVIGLLSAAPEMEVAFEVSEDVIRRVAEATLPQVRGSESVLADAAMSASGAVRRVLRVVFDSFASPAPAVALRSGEGSRRLVVSGEAVRLDLELTATRPAVAEVTEGEIHVLGRVESSIAAVSIRAETNGRTAAVSEVDEAGFFELVVSPGTYDLVCGLEEGEAAAEGLDLRA